MTEREAKENLAMMRRDKMSLKVEKNFLTLALKIGKLSDEAKEVYRKRIGEL